MPRQTDPPLVDRRLFVGMLVVLLVQWAVWFGVSVIWFGGGGTTEDVLVTVFFGMVLSIPVAVAGFVIGLGPGVTLWTGIMALCRRARLSERQSAMIAAPLVTWAVSGACLVTASILSGGRVRIDGEMIWASMQFAAPGAAAGIVYASLAWRVDRKFAENTQ